MVRAADVALRHLFGIEGMTIPRRHEAPCKTAPPFNLRGSFLGKRTARRQRIGVAAGSSRPERFVRLGGHPEVDGSVRSLAIQ